MVWATKQGAIHAQLLHRAAVPDDQAEVRIPGVTSVLSTTSRGAHHRGRSQGGVRLCAAATFMSAAPSRPRRRSRRQHDPQGSPTSGYALTGNGIYARRGRRQQGHGHHAEDRLRPTAFVGIQGAGFYFPHVAASAAAASSTPRARASSTSSIRAARWADRRPRAYHRGGSRSLASQSGPIRRTGRVLHTTPCSRRGCHRRLERRRRLSREAARRVLRQRPLLCDAAPRRDAGTGAAPAPSAPRPA